MTELIILFFLIFLNGFFSMAEIALVSSRKARLEGQAGKGDQRAKKALDLAQHPDKFLSTVQIGITTIGILTGIYSGEKMIDDVAAYLNQTSMFAAYSNGIATAIVVVIITFFSLVFGELVPKRLGMASPESIAKTVAAPMMLISKAAHPFVWLLTRTSGFILKILF